MRNIFFDRDSDLRVIWIVTLVTVFVALTVALLVVLMVGVPMGFAIGAEYEKCNNLESVDQAHLYNWSLWSGCRVQTQTGFFIDVDSPSVYELIHESPSD